MASSRHVPRILGRSVHDWHVTNPRGDQMTTLRPWIEDETTRQVGDEECLAPAARPVAQWRTLVEYATPHRSALAGGAVLSVATGATGLALPLAARALIDDLARGRPPGPVLLLMLLLVVGNAGFGAAGSYVLRRTAEFVVLAARRHLVDRLLGLRVAAIDRTEPGDLISRATSDTTLLREAATTSLVGMVTSVLVLAGTLVMMGLLDPVLLLVTVGVIGVVGAAVGVIIPRITRTTRHAQDAVGLVGAALERVLGAFRTVKAAGAEARERDRIDDAMRRAFRSGMKAAKWSAVADNAAGLAVQLAFLTVLGLGGARVASGAIVVGTLIAFLLYTYYLLPPIQQLVRAVNDLQAGLAAVGRIHEVDRLAVEPHAPEATARPASGPFGVVFDQVRFRYRPGLPEVHRGISFVVPPLGMTAVVGPSGAGKTTLFALLERFYDLDGGRLLVNGREIRDWPVPALRAAIGYVEQDSSVLSGTVRENLLFGVGHADGAEIDRVLRLTRLDGLVSDLPDGLDTMVGHRGTRLSGGERQRVAIARALLRRPRLLLLDEATSHLDAVNEAALRCTIADTARTTTVLVVAHRLSTVTMADRIVVVDSGVVRAVGTHAELVRTDALYSELATTQFLTDGPGPTGVSPVG
jgi:ATP-binding cassette subfamily C protein